jgi:hypothetical protein
MSKIFLSQVQPLEGLKAYLLLEGMVKIESTQFFGYGFSTKISKISSAVEIFFLKIQ